MKKIIKNWHIIYCFNLNQIYQFQKFSFSFLSAKIFLWGKIFFFFFSGKCKYFPWAQNIVFSFKQLLVNNSLSWRTEQIKDFCHDNRYRIWITVLSSTNMNLLFSFSENKFMKIFSLIMMTVLNSTIVLIMRYLRTRKGDMFIATTAVISTEGFKLILSLILVLLNEKSIFKWAHYLWENTVQSPKDCAKMSVPGFIYTLQNNLFFIVISNLDVATSQVSLYYYYYCCCCYYYYYWFIQPKTLWCRLCFSINLSFCLDYLVINFSLYIILIIVLNYIKCIVC